MRRFIKDLKHHKTAAQRKVFDLYADYLFRICYRYLNDRMTTEDVLSQVFLNIFEKIKTTDIEKEAQLKAWMKRIAINESLQEIRKRTRFPNTMELVDNAEASDLVSDGELLEKDLLRLVLELPDGYRTVFSLHTIEGYKHEEIALQLGISVGTSKSQLSKARKMLRKRILEMEMS